jgi:hypothetical protein
MIGTANNVANAEDHATPFKLSLPNAISNERRDERKPRVTTPRTLTTATTNRGGLLRKYG